MTLPLYLKIKHEILLKISDIIASHGAEIAYPTSTLHLASTPTTDQGSRLDA